MYLDSELIDELNLLMRYRASSSPEGFEVNESTDAETVAAAKRLFSKGVIERSDGGALTERGRGVIELMTQLLNQLSPALEPI